MIFGSLDISASALTAQRTRLNVVASNLANRFTTHDAEGNVDPYQRRIPVLAPGDPSTESGAGVHVEAILLDDAPFKKVHEPGHPAAGPDGYVKYPNIEPANEMINALEASRAYEANITAAEATKSMINNALQLLA